MVASDQLTLVCLQTAPWLSTELFSRDCTPLHELSSPMYWCLGTACCFGPAHCSLLQQNLSHGALLPYLRCLPLMQVSHLRKTAEICPRPVLGICLWLLVGLQSKAEIWVTPPTSMPHPRTMLQMQKPLILHFQFPAY